MRTILPSLQGAGWSKMPAPPALLFLVLLLVLLSQSENPLLFDLDVGWLIRTGELIWQDWRLPQEDVFSFTQAGRPWILYQWGTELYFGMLHRLAGLGGVVWGTSFFIALTYALLLCGLRSSGLPLLWALALVLLAIAVNKFYWLARPATLGFFLYMVVLLILENYYRSHRPHQLWILPPLFLLWANCHLSFIIGFIVLLLYVVYSWWVPEDFWGMGPKWNRTILLMTALCIVAPLANPYGMKLFLYIIHHITQPFVLNAQITEMMSPNFHQHGFFFFFVLIVLVLWLSDVHYPGRPLFLSLLTITLGMSLYSIRNIPFFSLPAVLHLGYSITARCKKAEPPVRVFQFMGWGFIALGAVLSLSLVSGMESLRPGFYRFQKEVVPQKAADFLANRKEGLRPLRIFSWEAQWASYFIYRLYPEAKVFIDTRFDFYGNEFFQRYMSLRKEILCQPQKLDPWQADFLVMTKEAIDSCPSPDPSWVLVYKDEKSLIYQWKDRIITPQETPEYHPKGTGAPQEFR